MNGRGQAACPWPVQLYLLTMLWQTCHPLPTRSIASAAPHLLPSQVGSYYLVSTGASFGPALPTAAWLSPSSVSLAVPLTLDLGQTDQSEQWAAEAEEWSSNGGSRVHAPVRGFCVCVCMFTTCPNASASPWHNACQWHEPHRLGWLPACLVLPPYIVSPNYRLHCFRFCCHSRVQRCSLCRRHWCRTRGAPLRPAASRGCLLHQPPPRQVRARETSYRRNSPRVLAILDPKSNTNAHP